MGVPFCRYFKNCPVCLYQDLRYEESVRVKANLVRKFLDIDPKVIPSPKDKFYKFRVNLRAKRLGTGRFLLGYTQSKDSVFWIDLCPILNPKINENLKFLADKFGSTQISTWDPIEGIGKLESLTVLTDGDLLVLSVNLKRELFLKEFTFEILDENRNFVGVWWFLKEGRLLGGRGEMFLGVRVGGKTFRVSPFGYYPDNLHIVPEIWDVFSGYREVLAVGTGITFPLESVLTYVDEYALNVREIDENKTIYFSPINIEAISPKIYLSNHLHDHKTIVINLDGLKSKFPLDFAGNFEEVIVFGSLAEKIARFLKKYNLKPQKAFFFDVEPYTRKYLLSVIARS
ncbi:MAG: hypothetical protein ACO2O5_00210 [Candidatus Caldipriscus sp.]